MFYTFCASSYCGCCESYWWLFNHCQCYTMADWSDQTEQVTYIHGCSEEMCGTNKAANVYCCSDDKCNDESSRIQTQTSKNIVSMYVL